MESEGLQMYLRMGEGNYKANSYFSAANGRERSTFHF